MEKVYIFDFGDKIKVGRSSNVQRRLRTIECSSGVKAKNVYTIDGGREEEHLAHSLLENRLEGEFFAYPFDSAKEILDKIASGEIQVARRSETLYVPLSMGRKVKIMLKHRDMSVTDLANKLGTTRQNLTNKFKRDNFSEKEIAEIADALNCEFIGTLKMLDTGEEV